MKSIQKLKRLTLGALLSAIGLQAATPTIIPADFAFPLTTVSEANRGFAVRVKQATTTAGELVNSTARTEAQLAGTLVNRVTGLPYENIIDLAAATFVNGVYTETTAINYEQGGSTGLSFPGIPGTESHTDNIAMEVLTWLELPTGTHSMIVNSDDGFRVTVGKESRDQTTAIELGKYEGGRGAGDSVFNFTVTQSGIYSFRLIYQEGGGGANCSWFTAPVGNPEARVLVNDAAGIKAYNKINAATPAYVSVLLPPVGSSDVSPGIVFKATLNNGSASQIPVSSVKLTFDGASVAAAVTAAGGAVQVSYDPPGLLEPGSKHTVVLEYLDGSTARKLDYSFTSSSTGNLVLPTPIWIEKFESTAEGAVPTGWTLQNYSGDPSGGDPDFNNPNNDVYLDWVVIPKSRVLSASWDAGRRLNVNEQFVNGQLVTSLVDGNFLYAESDNRGGSQVQYAFSPDQNLTGKTNIYLSFHNIYEQNQDSIGAVEYSIDKGATWLPILYMLDGPDIKLGADGKPDGYATMTAANPDTAVDPNGGVDANGEPVRTYGAFIGVATNQWPNIGSFISARLNDNPNESKRIELFRLPKADGQATVRLRFAQAGTGSWYFGIDNVGLYSINNNPATVSVLLPPIGSSNVSSGIVLKATIISGTASIPVSSVKLTFDGASVNAAVTSADGAVQVSYDPPGLLEPGSKHTVVLEYLDGTAARKLDYSFTVSTLENLVLTTPIWIEKFDSTAEGAVPTGWTLVNHSGDPSGEAPDFNNPKNDVYLDWVVIPKSRVLSASWEAARRLNVNEQFVNGQLVTSLVDGNFLYAESDNRGGSQVQYAFSPDQNLTGKTNIYLSFHNIYEQNQDSMGAVEYSIDKGATWLPILYMLDGPDIKLGADGKPDGYATMTAANPDTAIDPNGGVDANGGLVRTYGAFIGVATNQWPNIGSFISARINDNPIESKRIELFRLPKADNQATVRLRFAHAGTGSWYFGIDNVGFYTINSASQPALKLNGITAAGGNVTITWAGAAGIKLQSLATLGGVWADVTGSDGASTVTVPAGNAAAFFRLVK